MTAVHLGSSGMLDLTNELPIPDPAASTLVGRPRSEGPGNWFGAPSVLRHDGWFYLAVRMRDRGERGHAVTIARSRDGVDLETLAVLGKDDFGAASLERPSLHRLPGGGWRLYMSCATPGGYHWWVEALDAHHPGEFEPAAGVKVWTGDAQSAIKDPFVVHDGRHWHAWVCVHPLSDPEATDRMWTDYYSSDDGLEWRSHGTALRPAAGTWCARGARVAFVARRADRWVAYFDGRASASDNAEEVTGIAWGNSPGDLRASEDPLAVSTAGSGSLRYLSMVGLGGGSCRLYYEASLADGSHALFTQLCPSPRSTSGT